MISIKKPYLVLPIIVVDVDYFKKLAAHFGCAVSTWATSMDFTISHHDLTSALMFLKQQCPDFAGLKELHDLLEQRVEKFFFYVSTPIDFDLDMNEEIPF
jgi:hypothetical protein